MAMMLFLLVKIILSVSTVFGLTWLAEYASPRLAGIISGMPIGTIFVILFVGLELGDDFALATTIAAGPAIATIIAFAFAYYALSFIRSRFSVLICSVGGVAGYFLAAWFFSALKLSFLAGLLISFIGILSFSYAFFSPASNRVKTRHPMTMGTIAFRAGLSTFFVVVITGLADVLGPLWSGLLTGFPMTMLPFLIIIHVNYPPKHVQNIIRNIPLGLGSLLGFLIIARLALPEIGTIPAICLGLAGSIAYLICLGQFLKFRKSKLA